MTDTTLPMDWQVAKAPVRASQRRSRRGFALGLAVAAPVAAAAWYVIIAVL